MPTRLDAFYIDSNGNKLAPVMIHRAILGSLERFVGILIEEYAGDLPLWLSPIHAVVLNISNNQVNYCDEICKKLNSLGIRTEKDLRNEKISYKVREHSVSKVPIIIAVGKKEVSDRTVSVRRLGSDDTSVVSLEDFTSSILHESLAPNK